MNQIPKSLTEKIQSDINARLKPNLSLLITKLFATHAVTAVLTLSVCPQFGFKIFKLPVNLMNSFMFMGMPACYFLCGLFFTATSILVASLILTRDELRALKFQKTLSASAIILGSIGFFSIMSPNLFVEFSLLWLLGAVIGVVGTLEVSSRVMARA